MSRHKNRKYAEEIDFPLESYEDLIKENKILKEENAKLKKFLGKSEKPDKPDKKDKMINVEQLKGDCPKCGGVLKNIEYTKMGEDWMFARCEKCQHRSAGKKV